jgi:hypothetical protein
MKTYKQIVEELSTINKDFEMNKTNFDVNNTEFQKGDDSIWFLKSDIFDITVKKVLDNQLKPFPDHYIINIQKVLNPAILIFLDDWNISYTKKDDVYTIVASNIDVVNTILTELKLRPIKE